MVLVLVIPGTTVFFSIVITITIAVTITTVNNGKYQVDREEGMCVSE